MEDFEEKRINEAAARMAKTAEGQIFLAWLFDFLGYDKPMENNIDVAYHGVWVRIREKILVEDLIPIEHQELRNKPVTEELKAKWQTTTTQQTQAVPAQETEDQEVVPQPLHRTRMNL